jgi:hypothetical protein
MRRHCSLQCTAAVASLDGQVGLASFTDERLARAAAPITVEEHHAKARDCLATWLSPEAVADCVARCDAIDWLDAQGVHALLRLAGSGEEAPRS